MTCPDCEYHKQRAARWRAEAYKHAGHDVIELPWVGLTDEEVIEIWLNEMPAPDKVFYKKLCRSVEAKLKEKNT